MQDELLLRYSRHILLPDIGIEGQERLAQGRVLIIGAGGLACPAAMYLASSGVGSITVVDDDTVELSNLQRQIAHTSSALGSAKVHSLAATLAALNPHIHTTPVQARADAPWLDVAVAQADVVLDCCDNFATRHAINSACVQHRTPLVSGAATAFDGQISVYDTRQSHSPCYACAFPATLNAPNADCATMGIFAPLVGILGAMQAAEAIKLLTGIGTSLLGRLLMLDGRAMQWSEVAVPRQHDCAVCAKRSLAA